MENQTPVFVTPTPQIAVQEPKQNNFLITLLSILLLLAVGIAGFFAYQTQNLVKELTALKNEDKVITTTSEATTEPFATTNPTANWKIYTNSVLKYTVKYPSDWVLDKTEAELPISDQNSQKLVISKGEYKLTILWPAAYGPGICLFDDQTRVGAPEMASYCEGKYIETKTTSGAITHRRLESPSNNQFEIYTLNKDNYFVTVPPTRFNVPSNFDKNTVLLMDQILSTYNPIN